MENYLDFEKSIAQLQDNINEMIALRYDSGDTELILDNEIEAIKLKLDKALRVLYSKLTPWQTTQVARHPERPRAQDYIANMVDNFVELAGDRNFAEDRAVISGIGFIQGRSVAVIGQERGKDTKSRLDRNFGMVRPEGYRKIQRLMELAEKYKMPVIALVDTPGAYPGVGAEERGQSQAIASSIEKCLCLKVPLLSIVIGEGGSGGAVAIASGDHVAMLEYAIYSVASPEAAASILWRDSKNAEIAAKELKITAKNNYDLGIIDSIIEEPVGGAHRHPMVMINKVQQFISEFLLEYDNKDWNNLVEERSKRFDKMTRSC